MGQAALKAEHASSHRMISGLAYFAIISVAFCFGLVWFAKRAEHVGLSARTAMDISLPAMVAGFFGARILHIVYEEPALYWAHPTQIVRVWEGGFVWYGGAVVGFLVAAIVMYRMKEPVGVWLDLVAPVGAASYSLGRVACFFEGCCYGRYCTLPNGASVQFPTQLFSVVWEACAVGVLLSVEPRMSKRYKPGYLFALWMILHGIGRAIMEYFRDDSRGPAWGPLTISMAISLVLVVAGAVTLSHLKNVTRN